MTRVESTPCVYQRFNYQRSWERFSFRGNFHHCDSVSTSGAAQPKASRLETKAVALTRRHTLPSTANPQLRASISSITVVFTVSAIVLRAQYTAEHNNSDRFDPVLHPRLSPPYTRLHVVHEPGRSYYPSPTVRRNFYWQGLIPFPPARLLDPLF